MSGAGDLLDLDPARLAAVAVRTTVVYLCMLVALRLTGRGELRGLTPVDLALCVVIVHAVRNAMVGGDTWLGDGLLAAAILLVLNWLVGGPGPGSAWRRG
jgi:uncharacterized membrane protein YcaP (DUF421 family)